METSRWIIKEWLCGHLPPGLFKLGGDLLMLQEGEESAECTLVWADDGGRLWWIDYLPKGRSASVPVHFGPLTATCQVTLTQEGNVLSCTLKPGNDGHGGTFTAEGSGPPGEQ